MSDDKPMFGKPYKLAETALLQALIGLASFILIAGLAIFVDGGPALSFGARLATAVTWVIANVFVAPAIWIGRHG